MIFNDIEKTFILIKRDNLIRFNKYCSRELTIKTTEIQCTLFYNRESERDEDYKKLKEFKEELWARQMKYLKN